MIVEPSQKDDLSGADLVLLYPTPVLSYVWPDSEELNAGIKRAVLDREARSPGGRVTSVGGWQSVYDFTEWDYPAVRVLVERMHRITREMVRRTVPYAGRQHLEGWHLEAWANVNRRGAFNRPHNHTLRGNIWSGIYYVDPGDRRPGSGGCTRLHDPSEVPKEIVTNPDPFEREKVIEPRAGLMVMFPGPLFHRVERYDGDASRITVAFNVAHPGFTIPRYEPTDFWWQNFRGIVRGRRIIVERTREWFDRLKRRTEG